MTGFAKRAAVAPRLLAKPVIGNSSRSEEHTSEPSHDQISYAVFCLKKKKHTSELQSRSDLVCRLLLEKEMTKTNLLLPASSFRPQLARTTDLSRHHTQVHARPTRTRR